MVPVPPSNSPSLTVPVSLWCLFQLLLVMAVVHLPVPPWGTLPSWPGGLLEGPVPVSASAQGRSSARVTAELEVSQPPRALLCVPEDVFDTYRQEPVENMGPPGQW